MKMWLPQVGVCLLLQAGITGAGLLLQRWFEPPATGDERQRLL